MNSNEPVRMTVSHESSMISVIVPTYKEAENIPSLAERIDRAMATMNRPYELIIVDDDSGDGTDKCVRDLASAGFPVSLIGRKDERGLSSAVIRGFQEAKGRYLVCMDADLSHPPEAIPALVRSLDEPGVDFALGSRYVPGGSTDEDWGIFRWLNSKVATWLAVPFTRVKDPMSGFFALKRDVFQRAEDLNPIGYKIGLELIVKCRCGKTREIPIHFAKRQFGESKLSLVQQLNYIRHLRRLANFKYGDYSRFIQFSLVGASGMAADLSVFALLRHAGLEAVIARGIAIWVAMTWNFAFNRLLTFNDRRADRWYVQYFRFLSSCALGGLLSWGLFVFLFHVVPFFSAHEFLAAGIGITAGAVFNFLLSRYWVFAY